MTKNQQKNVLIDYGFSPRIFNIIEIPLYAPSVTLKLNQSKLKIVFKTKKNHMCVQSRKKWRDWENFPKNKVHFQARVSTRAFPAINTRQTHELTQHF